MGTAYNWVHLKNQQNYKIGHCMWYLWSNLNEILNPLSGTPGPEVMSNIFAFKTMGATFDGELFKEKIKLASKVPIELIPNSNEHYMTRCCTWRLIVRQIFDKKSYWRNFLITKTSNYHRNSLAKISIAIAIIAAPLESKVKLLTELQIMSTTL